MSYFVVAERCWLTLVLHFHKQSDKDCKGSLICYHRDSKYDYLPGCSGEHKYSK